MADVELVIKISEETYNFLKGGGFIVSGQRSGRTILQEFCRAIYNGTPLPKNHGRLVDADALWRKWVFDAIGKQEIDEAPTIIEATEVTE